MAIDISGKVQIVKTSDIELIKNSTDRVWRPRNVRIGPLPADQKYAVIAVALNPGVTVGDHDTIQTAIEGITGIQKAFVISYGIGPGVGEIPSQHDPMLAVTTGLKMVDNTPSP
jgi:hypothetical protein